jgi:FkbM family methyltransferase
LIGKLLTLWKKSPLAGHGLAKNPFMRGLYRLAIGLSGKNIIKIEGNTIHFEEFFGINIADAGHYEPFETAVVKHVVKPGFVCLDIGANVGYYSLLFAKLTGPTGRIYAFEPEKKNYSLLLENIRTNGYKNITAENCAVSDENGRIKLYISEDNAGDHRIEGGETAKRYQEINMLKIDDYLRDKNNRVDYVKLDIQGADFKAIKGMANTLKNNPDIMIQSEFWPAGMLHMGIDPSEYLQTLEAQGFIVYDIIECTKSKIWKKADFARMLSLYTAENGGHTDIFAARNKNAVNSLNQ